MKLCFKLLPVLAASTVALYAGVDENFQTLQVNGVTYTNVTITALTAADIYFSYEGGMGNAKLKNLSPDLQQHFHYNPGNAAAQEQQQAQANANYLASRPPVWGTDFPAALNQASSQNRCVLMDFTGSDWCPWCIKLDQVVFSTTQFAGFANSRLVLLRLDFPHNIRQSEDLRRGNAGLASRYKVDGYPTCILVDSSGKELWRQTGYADGGPDAFIARIQPFCPKPATPAATDSATTDSTGSATVGSTTQVAQATQAGLATFLNMAPKLGQNWIWISSISAGLLLLLTARAISKKSA